MNRSKSIGDLIDSFFKLREEKRAREEEIKALNARMDEVEEQILNLMELEKLERASGNLATATYKIDVYASVVDKEALTRWVVENNRFDLLQSRVNSAPIKEMIEMSNTTPPGVTVFNKPKLSITKRTKI